MMEECTLALQAWKDVDLNSKRQLWENQYMEIKDHRNSSISTRKYLNESTKSFRSELANSGGNSIPVEAYMELLKSYQEEIDRLSKRAKYGETCFVELFRIVSTPMDPVDALSILIKMNVEYSAEISQQTLELERLQNVSSCACCNLYHNAWFCLSHCLQLTCTITLHFSFPYLFMTICVSRKFKIMMLNLQH